MKKTECGAYVGSVGSDKNGSGLIIPSTPTSRSKNTRNINNSIDPNSECNVCVFFFCVCVFFLILNGFNLFFSFFFSRIFCCDVHGLKLTQPNMIGGKYETFVRFRDPLRVDLGIQTKKVFFFKFYFIFFLKIVRICAMKTKNNKNKKKTTKNEKKVNVSLPLWHK